MTVGEQGALTERDWAELLDGEDAAFGAEQARIDWRPKERHVTLRDEGGRLVGAAGAVVADVAGEGFGRFAVVGIGSVIVTRERRGRGLVTTLVDAVLALAASLGPDRAILFCRADLVGLYRGFGFAEIAGPVSADQPGGRIEMPEPAMWKPLSPDATWPDGPVAVEGLPF